MSLADRLKKAKLDKVAPKRDEECPVPLKPELLLHSNIPKPLHGVAPRSVLGAKWWNRVRKEAYQATNFHCLACGVHKSQATPKFWLEAHEKYEIDYQKGRAVFVEAVALCHKCHMFIHDGRLRMLLESGEITHSYFRSIIQHGERVLREAGLQRKSFEEREEEFAKMQTKGKVAVWKDWRLVIGRKTWKGKFKSFEEWAEAYGVE